MELLTRCRLSAVLALALLACACLPAAEASREAAVKAAFLHKFTLFVEWPERAFAAPDAPFEIGILGEDPFGRFLDELIAGETVRGRPIRLRRGRTAAEVAGCQVVYVCPSVSARVAVEMALLREAPSLMVSDLPRFADTHGGIGFIADDGRIRFTLNASDLERRGLKASAQLLALAQIVGGSDAAR